MGTTLSLFTTTPPAPHKDKRQCKDGVWKCYTPNCQNTAYVATEHEKRIVYICTECIKNYQPTPINEAIEYEVRKAAQAEMKFRPGKKMVGDELRYERIVNLLNQGHTQAQAARELGISPITVYRCLRRYEHGA